MAVITVEGNTPARAPQSRGLTNDRHLQARADGLTAAQDERPQSSLGTRYPTQSTARGPRSSPGPASPGTPAGVALAAPNSARTTSRPVTRISRGTGEPPPTPHRCLGEADAAVHSNPTLPGCGRNIGGSGDSDTFAKARYYNDVRPGQAREGTSRTHFAATTGPAPAPLGTDHTPLAGTRKPASHSPNPSWNKADYVQASRAQISVQLPK